MTFKASKRSNATAAVWAAAFLVSSALSACTQFSLYDRFSSPNGLSISPTAALVTANMTFTFAAAGGQAPYSFHVVSGGGSIHVSSGVYSAPTTAGTAQIQVTDAAGRSTTAAITIAAITPSSQLSISPGNVAISAGSSLTFAVSGGSPPYLFSITSGGGTLHPDTGFYEAPSSAGSCTIVVTDGGFGTASASVQILAAGGGMTINPASATVVANSSLAFAAINGASPYTFAIVAGSGTIDGPTGIYHAPGTAATATVRVTDALATTSEAVVTVLPPVSTVAITPVVPVVTIGGSITFTASGGTPDYHYSILPGGAGGSIDESTGVYGAPAVEGTEAVRVTDGVGGISDATVTIVPATRLVIYPASLTIAVGNTYQFGASGGAGSYSFSLYSGGDKVTGGGLYTAPATLPGGESSASATVRVTDSVGDTSDAAVTIVSGGPLAISPATAAVPEGESFTFTGTGGAPAYIFGVVGAGSIGVYSGSYTAAGPAGAGAATVTITDSDGTSAEATVDIVPATPGPLAATGTGPHTIDLSWTNNTSSGESIVIERRLESGGSYAEIVTLAPSETSFSDTDASKPPNTLYVYRIRATASSGTLLSPYSNEAFGMTAS